MSNNVATASGDKHKCGVAELMGRVEGDEVIFEGICCGGNIRRKSLLASGKPRDFTGKVVVVTNPDFDIEKTIFNPLRGVLQRAVIKAKLGVNTFWSESIVGEVNKMCVSLPREIHMSKPILEFMDRDCNFAMEHADDTFMDHLQFVTEYSEKHFQGRSPRVLLLHSIMGVLTNIFPMDIAKIPTLQGLCTEFEMIHIQAFPAVQRLLYGMNLVGVMASHGIDKLKSLESLTFHRVIDNEEMTIDAENLWIQLNYQLIHFLDFIPADNWKTEMEEGVFPTFIDTLSLLKQADKLMCNVDLDLSSAQTADNNKSTTLGSFIMGVLPTSMRKNALKKSVHDFSGIIKHSLDFKLNFAGDKASL